VAQILFTTKNDLHINFNTTVFHATPSYIVYVAEVMVEYGFDPKAFDLRICFIGVEPHLERTRQWKLEYDIAKGVQDEIIVRPKLEFHEPGSLPRTEGKAARVVVRGEI